MFTTDWFLLGILLISLLLGAWRGLVYEVISVLGWIAAFVLAQWFAPEVAERLPMQGSSQAFRYAAAFVLIFVLSVFASGLLSALVPMSTIIARSCSPPGDLNQNWHRS